MPGNYCQYKNCTNNSIKTKLVFHRFPSQHIQLCQMWIKNSGNSAHLGLFSAKQLRSKYLCSEHFDDDCYMSTMRKRLRHDAIPRLSPDTDDIYTINTPDMPHDIIDMTYDEEEEDSNGTTNEDSVDTDNEDLISPPIDTTIKNSLYKSNEETNDTTNVDLIDTSSRDSTKSIELSIARYLKHTYSSSQSSSTQTNSYNSKFLPAQVKYRGARSVSTQTDPVQLCSCQSGKCSGLESPFNFKYNLTSIKDNASMVVEDIAIKEEQIDIVEIKIEGGIDDVTKDDADHNARG